MCAGVLVCVDVSVCWCGVRCCVVLWCCFGLLSDGVCVVCRCVASWALCGVCGVYVACCGVGVL